MSTWRVLETARGGILLRGLGYESNDASVLTNVSADHLDLQGIHTLPELAEVKAVIAASRGRVGGRAQRRRSAGGCVRAPRAGAGHLLLQPPARPSACAGIVARRTAVVIEDGWIVERAALRARRSWPSPRCPATLFGLATHNVANALAATAGAMRSAPRREQVADGLRAFQPGAVQMPGRLNLYRLGSRVVIVDFAHNEAGVSVLLDVAQGIAGGRRGRARPVTLIIGTAGDRPDDTLRGIARIAGQRADHVVIKETRGYLRGRTAESVVGEFQAGLAEVGIDPRDVPVYESETGGPGGGPGRRQRPWRLVGLVARRRRRGHHVPRGSRGRRGAPGRAGRASRRPTRRPARAHASTPGASLPGALSPAIGRWAVGRSCLALRLADRLAVAIVMGA